MANLNILGKEFANVSGFKIPDINENLITYIDVADTTAIAEDVTNGKTFYSANGIKTIGTAIIGTPEITITTSGAVSQELEPGTVYHFTSNALTSLTITFGGNATDQYHFDFISNTVAINLTLPNTVIMPESFGVEINTKYEIDIINNYGVYAEWVYEVTT